MVGLPRCRAERSIRTAECYWKEKVVGVVPLLFLLNQLLFPHTFSNTIRISYLC